MGGGGGDVEHNQQAKGEPIKNNNHNLGQGDTDDAFVKNYERQLSQVRWVALAGNALYSFNRFLGYCTLTWSLTVVLGGVGSNLTSISKYDYYFVVELLLLEAVRLSVTRLFRLIALQKLFYVTTDPRLLVYHSSDKEKWLFRIRFAEQIIQLLLVFTSMVLSVYRLLNLPESSTPAPEASPSDKSNFIIYLASLQIFYWIVFFNTFVFGILSFFKPILLHHIVKTTPQMALLKYHDHIVWIGTEKGFVQSCADVDILSFAFQVQAEEYRSNVRAPVVMKNYEDLMRYLCCHPRFKGFEKAARLLESADPYEVEATANVVGCWMRIMKRGNKCKTLILQRKLLTRLADTLDHEESGRAATSSFEALAEYNAEAVARLTNSAGNYLADILMDMIHDLVKSGKPDKAVVLIKVWNLLLPVILKKPTTSEPSNSYRDGEDSSQKSESTTEPSSSDSDAGDEIRDTDEANGDVKVNANEVKLEAESELSNLNLEETYELKFCKAEKVGILLKDLVQIVTEKPGALKRTQAVSAYGLSASGAFRADGPAMEGVKKLICLDPHCRKNAGKEHILPYEYGCVYYVLKGKPRPTFDVPKDWHDELRKLEWTKNKIEIRNPLDEKSPEASEMLTTLLRLGPAVLFGAGVVLVWPVFKVFMLIIS